MCSTDLIGQVVYKQEHLAQRGGNSLYQCIQPLSDSEASYLVIVTLMLVWKHMTHLLCVHWKKKPREVEQLPKAPLQVGGKLVKIP